MKVVLATAGGGKSKALLEQATNAAKEGRSTYFLSLELQHKEVLQRIPEEAWGHVFSRHFVATPREVVRTLLSALDVIPHPIIMLDAYHFSGQELSFLEAIEQYHKREFWVTVQANRSAFPPGGSTQLLVLDYNDLVPEAFARIM